MNASRIAALVAMLLLTACSSVPSGPICPASYAIVDLDSHVLAPGDRIAVHVFRQLDMSGEFTVDSDGMLSLPLIGIIDAAGLTTEQLSVKIKEVLESADFLVDPSLTVTLVHGGEVYVVGEINKSSAIPYKPHMKVVHALAAAGGVTYRGGDVSVKRGGCWLEADYETPLAPGDVISVSERFF